MPPIKHAILAPVRTGGSYLTPATLKAVHMQGDAESFFTLLLA